MYMVEDYSTGKPSKEATEMGKKAKIEAGVGIGALAVLGGLLLNELFKKKEKLQYKEGIIVKKEKVPLTFLFGNTFNMDNGDKVRVTLKAYKKYQIGDKVKYLTKCVGEHVGYLCTTNNITKVEKVPVEPQETKQEGLR